MAYYNNDKSDRGTPGLLFRQRLEYGVGQRGPAGDWKMLWSMYSHEVSVNPQDENGIIPDGSKPLNTILGELNDMLLEYAEIALVNDTTVLTDAKRLEYVKVLASALKMIDEIGRRGNLYETVRVTEGARMP